MIHTSISHNPIKIEIDLGTHNRLARIQERLLCKKNLVGGVSFSEAITHLYDDK